jgi:hypothetical protein
LAIVAGEVVGTDIVGVDGRAPAAARFADEGGAAGCNVPASAICGVDCADGNAGAADRATSDVSSDASWGFHQAHREPDWQPVNPAAMRAIDNARMTESLMFLQSRSNVARVGTRKRRVGLAHSNAAKVGN